MLKLLPLISDCFLNRAHIFRKEGYVSFNDALNTFYVRLYGVRHMVKIAREATRCRHMGYSFQLVLGLFYMHHPTDRIAHTTAFVTPVVEHWLERETYIQFLSIFI